MKKYILVLAAIACVSASCCSCHKAPKHSKAAQDMMALFEKTTSENKVMYGHQDDLLYGHYWNVNYDGTQDYSRSDVLFTAGDFPAVVGFEIGEIERGGEYSLDSVRFDYIREAVKAHYGRGGVVTFSWHPNNPLTGGTAWDVSSNKVVASVLPGGENHEKMMSWIDIVSEFLLSLRTDDGELIPIVWRPWHEHVGNWFWWCVDGPCTEQEYSALWKMTFDYMVGEKGLDNLIWAISPDIRSEKSLQQIIDSYPGDEYVDIIGVDCYGWQGDPQQRTAEYVERMAKTWPIIFKFAEKHGKMVALTETGVEGMPYEKWWTEGLAKAIEGRPIIYALTWRNASDAAHVDHYFSTFPGQASEEDFKAFHDLPWTLFLKDIQ